MHSLYDTGFAPNRGPPVKVPEVFPLGNLCGLDAVVLLIELEQHVGGKLVPVHGALPCHVYLVKQLQVLENTRTLRGLVTRVQNYSTIFIGYYTAMLSMPWACIGTPGSIGQSFYVFI